MKLDLFIKTNDLKEIEFKKIEYKNNSIYAYVTFNIEIEYMANGCRPEFDEKVNHLFIFKDQEECMSFDNTQYVVDYNYDGEKLVLSLTDGKLIIKNCEIDIKQNI